MKFSIISACALSFVANCITNPLVPRASSLYSSALDTAQCYDLDVDGLLNLNCVTRK